METHTVANLQFLSYSNFDVAKNLTNVVSTRLGGLSEGPYNTLNLSFHVGDDPDTVLQNRAMLSQVLGIEPETLTIAEQVHQAEVAVVKSPDRGKGAVTEDHAIKGVDAMVTNAANTPLMMMIADCAAVSIYDPANAAVGLAHAGWRGTLGRIVERTIATMTETFGSDPHDLIAGISPSIGKAHYEVGEDVFTEFKKEFGSEAAEYIQEDMDGTCYLDLWGFNEAQLRRAGVPLGQIQVAGQCTACHGDRFYSHRHEGGDTGRFGALIMLHASGQRNY